MIGDDRPGFAQDGSVGGPGAVSSTTSRSGRVASSALEQEQRRLAQVIHDGPAQVFANLALHSEIIERLIGVDNARAVQEVRELRDEALRAASELRQLIDQVAPPGLLRRSLGELLREHADRLERRYGLAVAVDTGDDLVISDADKVTVFRVIQEALQNVLRHSGARRALVRVYRVSRDLVAEVRDQGTGFQATDGSGQEGSHLGLAGMRERAQMAGGTLLIESSPAAGTRVILRLPR
jgi:two-component system sensor histidine kinase DegS